MGLFALLSDSQSQNVLLTCCGYFWIVDAEAEGGRFEQAILGGQVVGVEQLASEDYSHGAIAAALTPRHQELILLPTERCNFRCTYCYEDFLIGAMKAPIREGVKNLISNRVPDLSTLHISWFGGEPLVARAIVLEIQRHAHAECARHGTALSGHMTTNGYFLERELFEELVDHGNNAFQITLDGWGDDHDRVRKQGNGKGTFERIWANLGAMRLSERDFRITIRIHARRDNTAGLRKLVERIARQFGTDPRFELDFQHLRDLGGEGGQSIESPLSWREMRSLEGELREVYRAILAPTDNAAENPVAGPVPLEGAISEALADSQRTERSASGPSAGICYAAKPNSLLVRADGRIGKCTVAMNDVRNTIGSIEPDGGLVIDNDRLKPWIRGMATRSRRDLECPLMGL